MVSRPNSTKSPKIIDAGPQSAKCPACGARLHLIRITLDTPAGPRRTTVELCPHCDADKFTRLGLPIPQPPPPRKPRRIGRWIWLGMIVIAFIAKLSRVTAILPRAAPSDALIAPETSTATTPPPLSVPTLPPPPSGPWYDFLSATAADLRATQTISANTAAMLVDTLGAATDAPDCTHASCSITLYAPTDVPEALTATVMLLTAYADTDRDGFSSLKTLTVRLIDERDVCTLWHVPPPRLVGYDEAVTALDSAWTETCPAAP